MFSMVMDKFIVDDVVSYACTEEAGVRLLLIEGVACLDTYFIRKL